MFHLDLQFDSVVAPTHTWAVLPVFIDDSSNPDVCLKRFKFNLEFVDVKSWSLEGAKEFEVCFNIEVKVHLEIFLGR